MECQGPEEDKRILEENKAGGLGLQIIKSRVTMGSQKMEQCGPDEATENRSIGQNSLETDPHTDSYLIYITSDTEGQWEENGLYNTSCCVQWMDVRRGKNEPRSTTHNLSKPSQRQLHGGLSLQATQRKLSEGNIKRTVFRTMG